MRAKTAPPMIPPNSPVDSPPLLDMAIGVVFMIEFGVYVILARTPSPVAIVDVGVSRTTLEIIVVLIVVAFEVISSVVAVVVA